MAAGVLGWSAQRGPITSRPELASAVRDGEAVLHATAEHVICSVHGDAPLIAVVRLDNDVAVLARQIMALAGEVDELRSRLTDIAEAAVEALVRR